MLDHSGVTATIERVGGVGLVERISLALCISFLSGVQESSLRVWQPKLALYMPFVRRGVMPDQIADDATSCNAVPRHAVGQGKNASQVLDNRRKDPQDLENHGICFGRQPCQWVQNHISIWSCWPTRN